MKLEAKLITLMGLAWIFFILATAFIVARASLILYIPVATLSFLIIAGLLYFLMIKRIVLLNKKLYDIAANLTVSSQLEIKGNDEIASIAAEINRLLEIEQTSKNTETIINQLQKNMDDQPSSIEKKPGEHLMQLAHYDILTALPNRVFFNEILNKTINHSRRRNKMLAVILINLDAFHQINSSMDRSVGDYVLKELSTRFANTLRSEDILARSEGDEFIILLNDIGKSKFVSAVAEKLLRATSHPIPINSHTISVTASIGICIFPNDGDSLKNLLKNVSIALDKAKHSGGNTYQFYTQEMNAEAREYIQLDSALRKAIQNKELILFYQPKLNIKSGNITGVEALIRWSHPSLGLISPSKFIPLAEESGLIMEIGEWTLREACKTNKFWQDEGYEHLIVAVNLSPKQFYHPDIVHLITKILNETGLKPGYLEIEISESIVMDNVIKAEQILNQIKSIGVQLSIDHFGTGYTSISHLKKFPINALKIDQTFIKGVPNIPNDVAITNAFIGIAHHLGFKIVAEGVETAEQVQFLASQGCDIVQGYYLSHPLPAQKIVLQFNKIMDRAII